MWYVEEAKNIGLPIGGSQYVPHPGCTTSHKAWLYSNKDGIGFFCNKCKATGFTRHAARTMSEWREIRDREKKYVHRRSSKGDVRLPPRNNDSSKAATCEVTNADIPEQGMFWLGSAGISKHEATSHGFYWSDAIERLVMPVYSADGRLLYYQARAVDGRNPKYLNPIADRSRILYSPRATKRERCDTSSTVTVTEDMLSAVRVNNVQQAVSSLGTKLSTPSALALGRFRQVNIWFDNDSAGLHGRAACSRVLRWYTKVCIIHTGYDPKHYSDEEIKEILYHAENSSHVLWPDVPDL